MQVALRDCDGHPYGGAVSPWDTLGWLLSGIAAVILIFVTILCFGILRSVFSGDGPSGGSGGTPGEGENVIQFDV